jgi:hypothetical protein
VVRKLPKGAPVRNVLLIVLLAAPAGWSQSLSYGAKGGVPFANSLKIADASSYTSNKSPAVFGPAVELHLLGGVSAEADLFYRRLQYDSATSHTTGQAFEVPLLAKYRMPGALLRPFIEAGFSFRRLARFNQRTEAPGSPGGVSVTGDPPELVDRATSGPTVGGGLELKLPVIAISAEIRYTRWGAPNFRAALSGLLTQSNQADLLLGVMF